jgi:hypothetical protein
MVKKYSDTEYVEYIFHEGIVNTPLDQPSTILGKLPRKTSLYGSEGWA